MKTVITAGISAMLLAACSSSGSSNGSSPTGEQTGNPAHSAVAYSACMRSHGVPKFPDPDSSGNLPKGDAASFGISDSLLQSARTACQHLLPNTGGTLNADSFRQCLLAGSCPPALVQQAMTEMRNFARCVRSHGMPSWPDPSIGHNGGPYFDLSGHGISRQESRSAQANQAMRRCGHEMPDTGGVPTG